MRGHIEPWKQRLAAALAALVQEAGGEADSVSPAQIIAEIPPDPAMGDIGFPMFAYAKILRKGPPQIAQMVCARLATDGSGEKGSFEAAGPYLNVRLDRSSAAQAVLAEVLNDGDTGGQFPFAKVDTFAGKKVMVEFSSPNTNKPLHLGHLRNDVLGESVSRILAACGADVRKVCIINDRGIHICKSMLAYQEHGQGKTPESEGVKSDHFVGNWYVCFSRELNKETEEIMRNKGLKKEEAEAQAPLMSRAQELLRKWEAGDPETTALWKLMNSWAVEGMQKTYQRTGVSFDQYYYESDTWQLGKEEVLKGLERGIFYRQDDGAVAVDLSAEKLDKKILLRSDGTSIYITQDFGTAINRYKDFPFDRMIYVVGSEQRYHFKVLFVLLDKLGFPWAKNLYHLSYGMVNLPEGKMKSREGTVVDADDLIDSLRDMAITEIKEKEREEKVGDPAEVAEKIALGALHYYLLQTSPAKDMLFDPQESLSFNGNTGPYLQYMGARISSMLRKRTENREQRTEGREQRIEGREQRIEGREQRIEGREQRIENREQRIENREQRIENREQRTINNNVFDLLVSDPEWELLKMVAGYPGAVGEAAAELDPSRLAGYLYELSKCFSRFYHDCPILNAGDSDLSAARLALSRAVLRVLKDALHLICVPFLEIM